MVQFDRAKYDLARAKHLRRCQLWANARRRLGGKFFDNLGPVERTVSAQLEAEFPSTATPSERA